MKIPAGDTLAKFTLHARFLTPSPTCLATLTLHGLKKKMAECARPAIKGTELVILVSESFGTSEAVLFWNLRGSGRKVIWLSFSELETELERVADWLGSVLGDNTMRRSRIQLESEAGKGNRFCDGALVH